MAGRKPVPEAGTTGPLLVVSSGDPGGVGTEILCAGVERTRSHNLPPVLWVLPLRIARLLLESLAPALSRPTLRVWGEEALRPGENEIYCLPDEEGWPECDTVPPAKVCRGNGLIAFASLERATALVLEQPARRALVTLPFHKAAMAEAGFNWPGHTEFLQDRGGCEESLMLLHSPEISVALVSNHVPVFELGSSVTAEAIRAKARLFLEFLRLRRIEEPLQVLGLDPHCGDHGVIGDFDSEVTGKLVRELGREGHLVIGPLPADATLARARGRFLAMYHDQGLPVFKLLSGGSGVNITLGIPFVRVSPDHGTAFDIAGRGQADPSSLCASLAEATQLLTRS